MCDKFQVGRQHSIPEPHLLVLSFVKLAMGGRDLEQLSHRIDTMSMRLRQKVPQHSDEQIVFFFPFFLFIVDEMHYLASRICMQTLVMVNQ